MTAPSPSGSLGSEIIHAGCTPGWVHVSDSRHFGRIISDIYPSFLAFGSCFRPSSWDHAAGQAAGTM